MIILNYRETEFYTGQNSVELKSKLDLILLQDLEIFSNKFHIYAIQKGDYALLFGKLYERFVTSGYDSVLIDSIFSPLNLFDTLHGIYDLLIKHQSFELWQELGNPAVYANSAEWTTFIESTVLIEQSTRLLEYYYTNWIRDPDEIEGPFSIDTFQNSQRSDLPAIEHITPSIIFSLEYLSNQTTALNIIERIALGYPVLCPGPMAYELWIQRKAFLICVKHKGMSFIIDNLLTLRSEILYYGLLKVNFDDKMLTCLKQYINSSREICFSYIPLKSVIKLICHKIMLIDQGILDKS